MILKKLIQKIFKVKEKYKKIKIINKIYLNNKKILDNYLNKKILNFILNKIKIWIKNKLKNKTYRIQSNNKLLKINYKLKIKNSNKILIIMIIKLKNYQKKK